MIALGGLAAWTTVLVITWAVAPPLGHDEAQYALAATDALAGDPARWFYLSRGMNAVAIPGVLLGGSEHALRLLPMLLGVAFAVATYVVVRRVASPIAAAWTLVVLAGSRTIVRMATDLLSDMPAAACLLAAVALIVDELDRTDGVRWRIVAIAPLFAAAFYIRYGSVIPIAVIIGAAIVVGARTLARRPLPVIVTAAVFLLCLVPHFIEASALTGSPLGILRWSREVPEDASPTSGLITYLTSHPFRYYGLLTPLVLVAGVVAGVPAVLARDRRRTYVWLVAIGTFIAMGLVTHGMIRYILVPVALLIGLGTDLVVRGVARVPGRPRWAIAVMLALGLVAVWGMLARRQLTADDYRANRLRGLFAAVRVIRADARGGPCMVVGYSNTVLEWYSGCPSPLLEPPAAAREAQAKRVPLYVVTDHAPTSVAQRKPDLAAMPGRSRILFVSPDAEVVRFDPL